MRAFSCPTCGAPLEAVPDSRTIHCEFCNRDFEREDLSGPRANAPASTGISTTTIALLALVPILGAIVWFAVSPRKAPPPEKPAKAAPEPKKPPPVPTPPAPVAVPPEVPAATPSAPTVTADLEPGPFTLTWNGKVKSSMDPEPRAGSPCTITGTFSSKPLGNAHCDQLVLQCAGKVYYDSKKKLEGMSMYKFHLGEEPVAGEVRAFRYGMTYSDLGARHGERAQITLDSYHEMLEAFRDELPSYRVKVTMDMLSPIRRGRPVLARTVPPFEEVVTKTAKVASKTGTPPFFTNTCTLVISPALAAKTTCRVTLTCGGKVVYGAGTTGFAECQLANGATGAPVSFVDPYPTPNGGDPELQANLEAKTAVLSDTTAAGATYSVSFTLE